MHVHVHALRRCCSTRTGVRCNSPSGRQWQVQTVRGCMAGAERQSRCCPCSGGACCHAPKSALLQLLCDGSLRPSRRRCPVLSCSGLLLLLLRLVP